MAIMIGVFLAVQTLLGLLDLWDLRAGRGGPPAAEPVRLVTVCFLVGITGLFLAVQACGAWLSPGPQQILDTTRELAAGLTRAPHAGEPAGWPAVLLAIALFYLAGLWDYLVHRFFSHHRWFWLTHEYHHLPCRVSIWMPGIFARPFGFLPVAISTGGTAATMYAVLALTGLPIWDLRPLLPAMLLVSSLLTASHSSFLRRWNWPHRLLRLACLTTPHEHLLHHRVDSVVNYGNFTTLWDRVFGTYLAPDAIDLDRVPVGLSYNQDFLGTLTWNAVHLSASARQRFQVDRFCNLTESLPRS